MVEPLNHSWASSILSIWGRCLQVKIKFNCQTPQGEGSTQEAALPFFSAESHDSFTWHFLYSRKTTWLKTQMPVFPISGNSSRGLTMKIKMCSSLLTWETFLLPHPRLGLTYDSKLSFMVISFKSLMHRSHPALLTPRKSHQCNQNYSSFIMFLPSVGKGVCGAGWKTGTVFNF